MSGTKATGKEILAVSDEIKSCLQSMQDRISHYDELLKNQEEYLQSLVAKFDAVVAVRGRKTAGSASSARQTSPDARRVAALYKKLEKPEYAHVMTAREANLKAERRGSLRVGRITPRLAKGPKFPHTEGFLNIVVTSHNKSGVGAELSPFVLRDEHGYIMENIWQCAKLYPFVPEFQNADADWSWKREIHVNPKTQEIRPQYWAWRKAGMSHDKPMRYPVGSKHAQYAMCHVWPVDTPAADAADAGALEKAVNMTGDTPRVKYSYTEARIKIYAPLYMHMATQTKDFGTIKELLDSGYNIQILDVDGPERREDSDGSVKSPYDQMPASTLEDGIYGESEVGSIAINEENIKALLLDTDQPFGHGYALACALLGHPEWITDFDTQALSVADIEDPE
jgi:hypothetical protein